MPIRAIRRVETTRIIVKVTPLHWPYIAPTMAAILRSVKPKVLKFRQRVKIPQSLAVYPQAQATAPPIGTVVIQAFKFAFKTKLRKPPFQPYYPATPTAANSPLPAWNTAQRKARAKTDRRLLVPEEVYATPAAPTTTPAVYAALVGSKVQPRRNTTNRRLVLLEQPEITRFVPFVATLPVKTIKREKQARRTSLPSAADYALPRTVAVHAANVKPKALYRELTNRRRKDVAIAPVFPQTPVTASVAPTPIGRRIVLDAPSRAIAIDAARRIVVSAKPKRTISE
jgi:hypothetical protein